MRVAKTNPCGRSVKGKMSETKPKSTMEIIKDAGYVLVVRCKDCIHYRYYGLSEETVSECRIDHCENPDADWFCADGKRTERQVDVK